MLELDVSCLLNDVDPFDLSHSIAEGGQNAGAETWANAKTAAPVLTLTESEISAARDFFKEFGAWDDDEIAAWSADEVKALILQYAAGDLREVQALAPGDGLAGVDWAEAERLSEAGTLGGRLFPYGDALFISLD